MADVGSRFKSTDITTGPKATPINLAELKKEVISPLCDFSIFSVISASKLGRMIPIAIPFILETNINKKREE